MKKLFAYSAPKEATSSLFGRGVWNVKIWALMAIVGAALFWVDEDAPRHVSPFWFLEPLLYSVFLVGIWINNRYQFRQRFALSRQQAGWSFVLLSWTTGMVYELALSTAGEIGGMHAKIGPSFILAQGFYWPFALGGLFAIRHLRLTLPETFFVGGAAGFNESVIFGGALTGTLSSPLFFVSPFVVAYFVLVYGVFLALALVFVDERLLWKEPTTEAVPPGMVKKLCYGAGLGFVSFLCLTLWGVWMDKLFNGFVGFP